MKATIFLSGGKDVYSFPFDFLDPSFVKVQVQSEDGSLKELTYKKDYIVDSNKTIALQNVATSATDIVIIYRKTPSDQKVVFNNASVIRSKDLNTMDIQLLHLTEETQDVVEHNSMIVNEDTNTWEAQGRRIAHLSDPIEPEDAVTKQYLKDWTDRAENASIRAETAQVDIITRETNILAKEEASRKHEEQSKEWALKSQASAEKAEASKTNAKTSETNAKTSETNAADYAKRAKEAMEAVQANTNTVQSCTSTVTEKHAEVVSRTATLDKTVETVKGYADTAQKCIVSGAIPNAEKAVANGVATLNANGNVVQTAEKAKVLENTVIVLSNGTKIWVE